MGARSFAIVPAAGQSTRMGRPKLLLPVAGRTLIEQTLAAWQRSRVDRVIVVVRPGDAALAEVVQAAGVDLVVPAAPPADMKASLACALAYIAERFATADGDAWLVAPADMPHLSSEIINALLDRAAAGPGRVYLPTLASRRGHPVLLPWRLAGEVGRLGAGEGLGNLIQRQNAELVPCDNISQAGTNPFADVDTPEDYRDLKRGLR
ncbi:MAG: nucleotidyltransferase family protein [Pirellulaceae bacterium]